MVSASLGASTALGFAASQLVAVFCLWRRAVPGVPAAPPTAALDLGALETCPATCPAPSLAFCVLDPLEEYALRGAALLRDLPLPAVVAGCSLASLAVGILIGRWSSAPGPRRPHGRRPGPAEPRRRA